MKKFIYVIALLFIIILNHSFSQDNTWFKDITIDAGIEGLTTPYVQCADVNGDDYPDILVGKSGIATGHSQTFSLYLNTADPSNPQNRKFVDFTLESGINKSRNPNRQIREYDMAVLADVDNDGDLDLVTSIYYHYKPYFDNERDRSEVFLNDGAGHFSIKLDAGIADFQFYPGLLPGMVDATGLSFLDFDFDGNLDLYIGTKFVDHDFDANTADTYFPDFLMKGNGKGSFSNVDNAGVSYVSEPLYGVNVTDYNNDGWQDVITSPYCRTGGRLLQNMGDGSFDDVAQMRGYSAWNYGGDAGYDKDGNFVQQAMCQWEAPTADFDNDGDMDILHCLVHGGLQVHTNGTIEGHSHISVNQGPPDYNYIPKLNIIHRNEDINSHLGDYGGAFIDFDNNCWQDLIITQGNYFATTDRAYLCIQKDNHEFYDITQELGLMYLKDASDVQACDFDLDGDNDFFLYHSKDQAQLRLLRNDIANQSNWISTKLIAPTGCNKSAVGVRVTVCSDSVKQIREIQTGMGHFGSQHPFILNFGLGDFNRVDSILIRWPMIGTPVTKIYNPATNINIVINNDSNVDFINIWDSQVPVIKFNKSITDFGELKVGDSLDMTFEVMNVGNALLQVDNFQIVKDQYSAFKLLDEIVPFTLQPNETKSLSVRFKPPLREKYQAELVFNSNAVNGNSKAHDLYASGHKDKALIAFDSNKLHFDSTKTNLEKLLTISNPGELNLIIDSVSISDNNNKVFSIAEIETGSLNFPLTIEPENTKQITVKFTPKARTEYNGNLILFSNAYKNEIDSVTLSGLGNAPTPIVKYNKVFVNFKATPVGKSSEVILNAENSGDGILHINNILVEDNDDNVFTFPDLKLPIEVQPASSRDINILFEPKEQMSYNRKITFYSNALNDPEKQLSLRGSGTEPEAVDEQRFDNESLSIVVSPVPFDDKFSFTIEANRNSLLRTDVALYNLNGTKIKEIFIEKMITAKISENINCKEIALGYYLLVIRYNNDVITIPVIKL